MAEVKNAFIKSKMNKDLDDRLLPNGEYRDALNVQVSKSESSDVGALENVLGNSVAFDFGAAVSVPGIKCIGFFVDEFNNNIYSFFTDNTDNSSEDTTIYNTSANNFVFRYNISTNDARVLVRGAFLNFSTTNPIIGVNLLEELLFFTDNRNQPRKINVKLANPNANTYAPTYYTNEDQISVAKYNPYECIRVFTPSQQAGAILGTTGLRAASLSKVIDVYFTANAYIGCGIIGNGVKTGTIVEGIDVSNGLVTTNKVQDLAAGVVVTYVGLETSMYDVSNAKLPDAPSPDDATANPYYDPTFSGDPDFLEDKFVRFSYRFRFDDGENSIFAPFTQPCFIPKQDGYFLENFNGDTDEAQTLQSTIVDFMENKVTKIILQIPLPANATDLALTTSPFKISAIDILYKESDGLAVQVVDTIPVDASFGSTVGANNIYQYAYESTKPFKTLPSKELVRVYDKIPVRAFSQEVISNRVVYGNFQDKHSPPPSLDYQVSVSDKYSKDSVFSNKTITEYPSSTVKQNRNYQVGIVLSDKFGRQSSTILSNNTSALVAGFGASTVFSAYQTEIDTASNLWAGDSLKLLVNTAIPNNKNLSTGDPGLYNGDSTSSNYNPLGWYSYKVVVQQKEQDYYNVYNAGAMRGNPLDAAEDLNTSYISLINDNINKVPRDLSEVGPLQKQFRSSVRLIGRVENTGYGISSPSFPAKNKQFYPGRLTDTTSSIEDLFNMFDVSNYAGAAPNTTPPITNSYNAYYPFYKSESDPLIAQITTTSAFGLPNIASSGSYGRIQALTVFETEPDLSRLDFYFETSTSGLISELNTAIATDTGGAFEILNFTFSQTEAFGLDAIVADNFYPIDFTSTAISDTTASLISVIDATGADRTSGWSLIALGAGGGGINTYQLRTASTSAGYQYYGVNANNNESYTFTFAISDNTDPAEPIVKNLTTTGQLGNIAPTITTLGGANQTIVKPPGTTGVISTQTAVNGAIVAGGQSAQNLTWSKVSGDSNFTISSSGVISNSLSTVGGSYPVVIRVTDAGGLFADATLALTFGNARVPTNFVIPQLCVNDGDMVTYYFTKPTAAFTDLDGTVHSITDSQYRSSTANTPTSGDTYKSGYLCNGNKHFWRKQYRGDWFEFNQDAAFFVEINTTNITGVSTTSTQASVEWKGANDTEWAIAKDINGDLASFGMNVIPYYDPNGLPFPVIKQIIGFQDPVSGGGGSNSQMVGLQGNPNTPASGDPDYYGFRSPTAYQTVSQNNTGNTVTGNRIFAFNGKSTNSSGVASDDGQYRITLGNFSSSVTGSYPTCSAVTIPAGNEQCIELGDANYKDGIASAYEYEVTKTSIGDASVTQSMSSVNVDTFYAREWITKYVTQFYTDITLLNEVTYPTGGPTGGYTRKFRRTGVNQEGTLDGAYLAKINDQGLREVNDLNLVAACHQYGFVGP